MVEWIHAWFLGKGLPTKGYIVKAIVMFTYESWTIKKAEHQTIDAFKLWCWRRLLTVSWSARRSNQSILKEINPEYSLEGLMLSQRSNTLATWCKELTHWKRPWYWERWRAGGEGDNRNRRWDGWMWHHQLSRHESEQILGHSWRTRKSNMLQSMGLQRVRHDWATE